MPCEGRHVGRAGQLIQLSKSARRRLQQRKWRRRAALVQAAANSTSTAASSFYLYGHRATPLFASLPCTLRHAPSATRAMRVPCALGLLTLALHAPMRMSLFLRQLPGICLLACMRCRLVGIHGRTHAHDTLHAHLLAFSREGCDVQQCDGTLSPREN